MIAAVSQSQSVQQRQSKNQKSHFPTILAPVKPLIPARKHPDRGVQKFSWRLNERIIVCPSPGKRRRAVKLHSTKPMATAQVVERLRPSSALERWLASGPRHAGHMAKPVIPLETRTKAIELILGNMQQKHTANQLGMSANAIHN